MMCSGNNDNGIRMYSSWSSSLDGADDTVHSILEVVISAVLVMSSPGQFMRLPPAVILTQLGSTFCGR